MTITSPNSPPFGGESRDPSGGLLADVTRSVDRLGRLADLTMSLSSASEEASVIRAVAMAVVSLRPDTVCTIRLVDRAVGGYRLAFLHGASADGLPPILPFGRGLVHRVAEACAPLMVASLSAAHDAVLTDWHRQQGNVGFFGVPVAARSELIGVLSVVFPSRAPLAADERELIELFAERAALTIRGGQSLPKDSGAKAAELKDSGAKAAELKDSGAKAAELVNTTASRETLAELAELGRAMTVSRDLSAVGTRLVEAVRGLLSAQAALLFRLPDGLGELEPVAVSRLAEPPRGEQAIVAAAQAAGELSLRVRAPVSLRDVLEDPRIVLPRDVSGRIRTSPCRAVLALPLGAAERLLGALVVLDRRLTEFPVEQVRLAQTFADQAALLVDNHRLVELEERDRRTARVLSEVVRAVSVPAAAEAALAVVARGALELAGGDVGALALWDADAGVLRLRCRVGALPDNRALVFESGTGPGAVVTVPEPIARSGGALESRALTLFQEDGLVALLVPLAAPDRLEGVLYVAARGRRRFSDAVEASLLRLGELARLATRQAELMASESRARAERDVAEERVRDLVDSLNTIVWEAAVPEAATRSDHPRPFTSITHRVEGMLGYPVDAWLGRPGFWARVLHAEDRDATVAAYLAAVTEGRDWEVDYRVMAADGRTVWFHEMGRVTRDAAGRVTGQTGLMIDITGRKGVEEERALLISAMEQTSDAIMITTADGAIAYVNPAFRRLTGYSLSEAMGHTPHLLRSGRERPSFYDDLWATLRAGEVWRGEVFNRRKDGTVFTAQQSIAPLRDDRGRITHFVSISQDISRRKDLESQLLQSQKMEAVGQLAGGVAHDFNNLLTVILGRADFLLERLGPDDALRREVDLILKTADRAGALTHQLLAFSRKQVLQAEVLDLNALVTGMGAMLQRLIGEDVDLHLGLAPDLGRVRADPVQVEQVVMNLVVNARDAMPLGGRLVVETENVRVGDAAAMPPLPGTYVTLEVRDTGCGMTPDVQARIFEPFFTTKDRTRGTGLGLSTVYGIVQQHHGHIAVESEPGRGTRFTIFLPLVNEEVRRSEPRLPAGAPLENAGTILLVEDDAALRTVVREMLVGQGHVVLEAADGEEALDIVERQGLAPALLLTDVVMPRMSGPEVAERLRRRQPALRVLYMSGYPDRAGLPRPIPLVSAPVLRKPFAPQALIRKLREVLGAGPTR
jgi:PAS domain S-box-containing protein